MTDDLRDRLTAALMDAMECKDASIFGPGNCRRHAMVLLPGPKHMGWPCPVATEYAEALLPFIRDEIADALDAAAADAAAIHRGYPNAPQIRSLAAVRRWLRARAEEVRRG
jgi:hypothetical protein